MGAEELVVGVDLGGTKIRTVVAMAEGEIIAGDQRPTAAAGGPEAVIERLGVAVHLGDDAGALGAVALVLQARGR